MLTSPRQADVSPTQRIVARKSWKHSNLTFVMNFSRHDSFGRAVGVDEDGRFLRNYKHALWFLSERM
jgi:hypothetical protein